MFPLFRDRTRRLICRTLFVLLGVLPTGAVLAWGIVVNGESYRAAICAGIAAQVGCDVRARHVAHPRQEITLLEGFELVDPETADVLLRCQRVEIRADERQIIASHPEMKLTGRNWWLPVIEHRLRLRARKQPPFRIRADEIALSWPGGTQTFPDCTLDFDALDQGNTALLRFQLDDQTSEPIHLQFDRTKSSDQPISSFALNTGTAALPCSLLAAALERNNPFGKASTFRGTLQASESTDGWVAAVSQAAVEGIDLNGFAQQYFPGDCSATGNIQLHRARFHRGRIVEAEGVVASGPGTISRSRLEAIAVFMRLTIASAGATADVPFEQLAAAFQLGRAGVVISGQCDPAKNGVVLRSRSGPILLQPGGMLPPWSLW